RSISKAKVLAEQAGIYASNLERYKTIRGGGKFALFCPSEGAAISDVAAMTDEALQALAAQHPIPLPNMEERAQQVAEREAQVQRWDDCEADVRAVLAGQPCPERDGEPYSQEELTIACQEISRSRDVAEAE